MPLTTTTDRVAPKARATAPRWPHGAITVWGLWWVAVMAGIPESGRILAAAQGGAQSVVLGRRGGATRHGKIAATRLQRCHASFDAHA